MKLRLLDELVCPKDQAPLELLTWDSLPRQLSPQALEDARRLAIDPAKLATEVVSGLLLNRARRIFYPIVNGVPRMLLFPTAAAEQFAATHRARIEREAPGFQLPDFGSAPGERDVLRTFSAEWVNYDWDGETYWSMTPGAMYDTLKFSLDVDALPLTGKKVLEVGIGIGGMANALSLDQHCEVFGVDLSYAVDVAQKHFHRSSLLHVVQASAFAPPFRHETFDLVYSHGVLHHTHSTKDAFARTAQLPKKNGRLYIWVYSPLNERRNLLRRTLMATERITRPVLSRLPTRIQQVALLPFVPLYLAHQNLWVQPQGRQYARYGLREAMHAARDRLTPRYVHRHSEAEVKGWFEEAGFRQIRALSERARPPAVPIATSMNTGVEGVRSR